MYCAYESDYPYSGEDETTVRDASGSSAKLYNFRRAVRRIFARRLNEAVSEQDQNTAVTDEAVKNEILSEVKKHIKKAVLAVWTRGRVANRGYRWFFDAKYWLSAVANVADLVGRAVDTVATRLLGSAEPIPAD